MSHSPRGPDPDPPLWAERLLGHLIGTRGPWRYIVGDLREEYGDLRERSHRVTADLWYCWQIGRVGARLIVTRTMKREGKGMESLMQDLHYALRTLWRRPVFTVVSVLTLALGIGSSTAMFSVVDSVLLEPLPYDDPGALVKVWQVFPSWRELDGLSHLWDRMGISYPQFRSWSEETELFESVAVFSANERNSATLLSLDEPARVSVGGASASLLPTLGVVPLLGVVSWLERKRYPAIRLR